MTAAKKIQWTEQQERAIAALDANVLVTASAGTGKTAVLSGRCVNLVSDAARCPNVLNMLVLTFTDAAAEQMRARIGQRLKEVYEQTHDRRLGRQLVLLQGADISTIHAFCKRLIAENFHEVGLDPAFRVIDADEAMLLKAEVLDETIEWAWRQEHLVASLEGLLRRRDVRDSRGFLASVIRLHEFLDSVASRDAWCERACLLAEATDPESCELGQAQKRIIADELDAILSRLRAASRLYEREQPGGKWGAALEADVIAPIAACRERLAAGDWDACAEAIRNFTKPKAPPLKGFPETLGKLIKDELRTKAMDDFALLSDLAIVNPDYMDAVGRSANAQSRVLIDLVRTFDSLYARRKKALNGLDFADLEHYALRLLTRPADSGEGAAPSETALGLRDRYKYIFVDEYQDINPLQQGILDALSSGDNIFVVGDVKQSIYAFRGAEPTIFLRRLEASSPSANAADGLRVDLNYNFRSAKGILDFVNHVFGRIMTEALAHMNYDEAARLRPGPDAEAQAPSGPPTPLVELHLLDEKADDADTHDESDAGSTEVVRPRQRQAALIAQRIQQIVGAEPGRPAMQIFDKDAGGLRNVEYRDIVVLMRSLAGKANDYVEILRLAGIPVICDATAGYFETTEIADVLCLLKVLDNPQRDIELATVLRSPLFGFTDSELATVRIAARDSSPSVDFHAAAIRYCDSGTDAKLATKLREAFATLERWRRLARRGQLADLLWCIYRETQYVAFVCALPNGQARKANLLELHDRAIQFEGFASSAGVPSLTRFVAFLEKLQEAGQDWTPAESAGVGNAVRILSVHKSKGLEFPIVFLAELDSQFNQRDAQADLVADAEHTLGLRIIDVRSNTKLSSLAHQVIAAQRRAVTLAEEMRILYVAMTRAKDRLILSASQKRTDCGKVLMQGLLLGESTVPAWLLKHARSSLEWLLYGLADRRALHEAFETHLTPPMDDAALFELHVWCGDEMQQLTQRVRQLRNRKKGGRVTPKAKARPDAASRQLLAELKDCLDWRYPFAAAVREPAKRSVSELTHHDDEFVRLDYSRALDRRPLALVASDAAATRPDAARQVGTATHLVISSLDLTTPVTRQAIERTRERLVEERALVPDIADRVDVEAILAFFESDLGALVLDRDNTVHREWPFTWGLRVGEPDGAVRSADAGEIVIVQGIIDMLVQTPGGLVVIDFKSDRVSGAQIARRAEAYRGQLDLYGRAAGDILGCPVRQKWLYFLMPQVPVAVEA
ncbi:MAG TPA: helicase-exonuclease AddAB subunit AddA [Sedimentisphaerales bacterium]|nr:helicase-exonuclease AddAB subunit AddA [Sedimentisphaerales bacterium]HRS13039.1 helicase-exonuclease AddAB subunit AddA [Sedimentisphaerales bacterium]HRV49852.1 helicase-exonuclease AddAB subunit AddA [Sedimentisphaerales bacterium]